MSLKKIKALLSMVFGDRYCCVIFDKKNPPNEGDTITVGHLVAEFKKSKVAKKK